MEPSAGHTDVWETLVENPSMARIGCGKNQDGRKKASSGGEDEHILVWDPRSVTQENKETIPAPPGVADVT